MVITTDASQTPKSIALLSTYTTTAPSHHTTVYPAATSLNTSKTITEQLSQTASSNDSHKRDEDSIVKPRVWGPYVWRMLHALAASLSVELSEHEQQVWQRLWKVFPILLPCDECVHHCRKYVYKYPLDTSSGLTVLQATIDLHNVVNRRLRHPLWNKSVEQTKRIYSVPSTILGRWIWHVLHLATANAPTIPAPEEQDQWRQFLQHFQMALPPEWRTNYAKAVRLYPIQPQHQMTLFAWSVRFHNAISQFLEKPRWEADLMTLFLYYRTKLPALRSPHPTNERWWRRWWNDTTWGNKSSHRYYPNEAFERVAKPKTNGDTEVIIFILLIVILAVTIFAIMLWYIRKRINA